MSSTNNKNGSTSASLPQLNPSNKPKSYNAFNESAISIKKINLLLGEVEAKANDKNKLSEVQSMIQTIEAEIAKASESISKIDKIDYKSYVNGTTAEISRAIATKNALKRKVNSIKNGAASVSQPSASASQPSVSASQPSASDKPEAGSVTVRLVRKITANRTPIYTATVVQSSMSGQLPTNTTNKSWKTPGGILVQDFTRNPLYTGPTNKLQGGRRKRTHKQAHRSQSHKRK
jgi:hypothetical protein|uniref:Uncharacterized protein n=1 Tax=viral metagenome TaxID=1070528 RepID=A0A6C0BF75_9ZZZZ